MIKKLIPQKVKSWLKSGIKSRMNKRVSTVEIFKYKPHKYGSSSYLIPRSPEPRYETCDLGFAVPNPTELWIGYGGNKEKWLASGENHVSAMMNIVKASGFSFTEGNRILDFGCGAGRMIRHLKQLSESCEIWGTDISANHIYWCKQYLSPPFHFATTTTIPHLPFEDRYFEFIYCGSVFTHIGELSEAWLLELRRILSPDGRLYITIHDNHTIELLNGPLREYRLSQLIRSCDLYKKSKSTLGMLAIGRNSGAQVFYDIDYFCKTLSSMHDILSVTQEAHGYQTAVLVKRKCK